MFKFAVLGFGFGMRLDWTSIGNLFFASLSFLLMLAWTGDSINAGKSVFLAWCLLEGHSSWQYKWDTNNYFDFLEFGMGLGYLILGFHL
jgi:hypothetical protein